MDAPDDTWVALFRAIGGATHAKMPMAALRAAAEAAGLAEVRTLLATGNLLFRSDRSEADLRTCLDGITAGHGLGAAQRVFLRSAAEIRATLSAPAFPGAVTSRPSRVLVHFLDQAVTTSAAEALAGWAGPERCAAIGREVHVDFPEGIGQSKLTPARLERLIGAPGTARNWNTLERLVRASA